MMKTYFLPGLLAVICTLLIMIGVAMVLDFVFDFELGKRGFLAGIGLVAIVAFFKLFRRLINRTTKDRFPVSHIEGDGYLGKTFSDEGRKLTVYKRAAGGNNLSYFCYYYDGNVQVKAPCIYSESFLRERIAE